jgi:DNA-binding Xre family transcriptional regulator
MLKQCVTLYLLTIIKKDMAKIEIEVTKINKILIERGLTQTDLYELIKSNGNEIGKDRINRIVNGKLTNYHTNTAKILANALGVSLDEIID